MFFPIREASSCYLRYYACKCKSQLYHLSNLDIFVHLTYYLYYIPIIIMSTALASAFEDIPLDILVNDVSRYLTLSDEFMLAQTNRSFHNIFHKEWATALQYQPLATRIMFKARITACDPARWFCTSCLRPHDVLADDSTIGKWPDSCPSLPTMLDGRKFPTVLPHHVQLAHKWTTKLGLKDVLLSASHLPQPRTEFTVSDWVACRELYRMLQPVAFVHELGGLRYSGIMQAACQHGHLILWLKVCVFLLPEPYSTNLNQKYRIIHKATVGMCRCMPQATYSQAPADLECAQCAIVCRLRRDSNCVIVSSCRDFGIGSITVDDINYPTRMGYGNHDKTVFFAKLFFRSFPYATDEA